MSDNFLEMDEALQSLTEELQRFRSSTAQIDAARADVSQLLTSIQQQTKLTADLLARSGQQLDAMTKLSDITQTGLGQVTQQQQESAAATEARFNGLTQALVDQQSVLAKVTGKLDINESEVARINTTLANEVQPKLAEVEGVARFGRNLLWFAVLLAVANVAISGYLVLLLAR
jgi:DNA repair exonuclease SbcCD ATPase subunit